MQRFFLKKQVFFLTIFLVVIIAGLSFFQEDKGEEKSTDSSLKITSSELGIASPSPVGVSGGLVIPASCPSDLHDAPWYGSACVTVPNVCGQTNRGILQCDGSCSVYAPPPISGCPPVTADIWGSSLVGYGKNAVLILDSKLATSCTFDDGAVNPIAAPRFDSRFVGPMHDTKTYRLSCVNTYSSSGWKEWTVNVCPITAPNVIDGKCSPDPLPIPTAFISVSPSHLSYKRPDSGKVTFTWDSSKADFCDLLPPFPADFIPTPPNTKNSMVVDYARDRRDTLTPDPLELTISCVSHYGGASQTARVEFCTWDMPFWTGSECIAGNIPPTVTLTAIPNVILRRDSSRLVWTSTDAGSCFMSSHSWTGKDPEMKNVPVAPNDSLLVSPNDDMGYDIECFSFDGHWRASRHAQVDVYTRSVPPPSVGISGPTTPLPFNSSTMLHVWSNAATECNLRYYDYEGVQVLSSITPNTDVYIITGNLTASRNYSVQCNNGTDYTPWESHYVTLQPQTVTIAITPGFSDSIPHGGASSIRVTSTNTSVCSFGYYDYSGVWTVSSVTPNTVVDIGTGNLSATRTYNFRCDRSVTDVGSWIPLTVNVGPKATLALCTEFGLTPFAVAGDTPSRNLYPNLSERLKAFYDTDPTDCAGTEVTSIWAQDPVNTAVSISGNGTTPQVITAGPTPGLTENVTITQGTDSITLHYNIQPPPCILDCSDKVNICEGVTFNDANACGTNNCTGTRSCDYNWKETSP